MSNTIDANRKPRTIKPEIVELFIGRYLVTLNASDAARHSGYVGRHAGPRGYELLHHPDIWPRIQAELDKRYAALKQGSDRVLRELWDVLNADPNELIEHRRVACRYCYGAQFKFQRTVGEMARDRAKHEHDEAAYKRAGMDLVEPFKPFDEQGGVGYDPKQDPNPDCPECFGEGDAVVFVKDTRDLTPAARALLAGVKQTKEGIEIKMHSKDKAVELLGKHLKLFAEQLDLNVKGDLATRILSARGRTSSAKNEAEDLA